ncbi:MAG TPA: hypothetical protein VHT28_18205 [Silvibacterium sp.]|nr:hypothetical protein [Silvibacterium sp.]
MKAGKEMGRNMMAAREVDRQAPAAVKLRIEELILYGFAPADRHRIAQGVQAELTRLVSQGRSLRSLKNSLVLERVEGGAFTVKVGSSQSAIEAQISRAIYQVLQRSMPIQGGLQNTRSGQTQEIAGDESPSLPGLKHS